VNLTEAIALVIREGRAADGGAEPIHVPLSRGDDPGAVRMQQLRAALEVVFDGTYGQSDLGPQLAGALWRICDAALLNAERCSKYRPMQHDEALGVHAAVESILYGEWFGQVG